MQRRVHRVWSASSKALSVNAAQHTLASKAAVAELAGQRTVTEDVTPRDAGGNRGCIGR